jgi:cytochrome P450
MHPTDPLEAVVHPDPYPYYAALTAGPPLVRHPGLDVWLATRAASVTAVLTDPACRVRPVAEPVPRACAGLPAGELFARLARMNDAPARHAVPKQALQQALDGFDPARLARRAAALAARERPAPHDGAALDAWLFATPVTVLADWLGFAPDDWPAVRAELHAFVACLSPLSTPAQLARANDAAEALLTRMTALVAATDADDATLVAAVQRAARANGWRDAEARVANLVGLLSQTYEATAGLLGNALLAWLTRPDLAAALGERPGEDVAALVAETARHDPPVQNTRRYVAARTRVAGVTLEPGSTVLVLLAAANRDPRVNPAPERFLLTRSARTTFGFGAGPHRCPGERVAHVIATAALGELLKDWGGPPRERPAWGYRPSANARLPRFAAPARTGWDQ